MAVMQTAGAFSTTRIIVLYVVLAFIWVIISLFLRAQAGYFFPLVDRVVFVAVTGAIMGGLLIHHRIETQKYAAELRDSNVRAQVYFDSASQGILIVALDGKIVRANPAVEHMFGYEHGQLDGRQVEILVPERMRASHFRHREKYLQAPNARQMEMWLDLAGLRKDGSEFPLEAGLSYISAKNGGPLVVSFITDVSERLAFERETRQAETLNVLGAVAAGIAHDLNNPLAILSSRAELMASLLDNGEALYPEMRQDLEVLQRNAQRASRIASGLLSLAAQRPTERKLVDVSNLADSALILIAGDLRRENIEVVTSLDRNLPPVLGDPNVLQRVVMNLLTNARDAMPQGGTVRIETGADPDHAGMLQLRISDTGAGIPQEDLPKVFDLFFTTKPSGTGLGLWLARRALQEHRGRIRVESAPGKGTRLILSIPVAGENRASS